MRSKRQIRPAGTVRCHVCHAIVPITFEQEHHVVPQAAGGTDGPVAQLCAGCHANLHRLADMLLGGRAGLADDSATILYPDPAVRDRAFVLAKTVVEHMTLKRDGGAQPTRPMRVTVELPLQVKLAAQVIASEHRGPTGRQLGLATWISALVKREVFTRYPHLKPPL